jgi:hypothetical protein
MRTRVTAASAALLWLVPVALVPVVVVPVLVATAPAAAADGTGQTYAQLEAILRSQGYTVIQTTSIGAQLAKNDCIVLKQLNSANGHIMLSLDCTGAPANGSANGNANRSGTGDGSQ